MSVGSHYNNGIEFTDKLYDHQPLPIVENGEVRMTIYTDKVIDRDYSIA